MINIECELTNHFQIAGCDLVLISSAYVNLITMNVWLKYWLATICILIFKIILWKVFKCYLNLNIRALLIYSINSSI